MLDHGECVKLIRKEDPDKRYVIGHVALEQARDAVNRWQHHQGDGLTAVAHKWARWVRVQGFEYEFQLIESGRCGLEAFPVTEATGASLAIGRQTLS